MIEKNMLYEAHQSKMSLIFNFSNWRNKSPRQKRKDSLEARAVLLIFRTV